MADVRMVTEGVQKQRVGEVIAWEFSTAANTNAPSAGIPVVFDESDDDNVVTSAVMPVVTTSVSGAVATLSVLQSLIVKRW